jgi:pyruvate/2-oxoglutarate dehydrogenase complex dihydrolipoamide dehydrogenase (E3) component
MGGDCLNFGCVPSKALIAAANAAHVAASASALGVRASPVIDYRAAMDHVRKVIAAIAPNDSEERFTKLGCTVIRAKAEFTGPRQARAGDTLVNAKFFAIATGSSPAIPPIDGLKDVPFFTNETIFENRDRPHRLIVIGGGAIGLELGQAHRRLGAEVAIVEAARLLGSEDEDAVGLLREALLKEGVALHEGAVARSVRREGGDIVVSLGAKEVRGTHVLVSVGRKPNVEGLALDKAGVAVDKKGVVVDRRLRTTNRRIFALGDVAGGAQFTHVAGDHASTVVRNMLFKIPAGRRDLEAPRATYTDPEIASIGILEAAARAEGRDIRVVTWPFKENDRAQTSGKTSGFAKIVTDRKGRILGAVIVGADAGEHIMTISLAMSNGLKIGAFTKAIAPYPTRSEIWKRAAGQWYQPSLFSPRTRALVRALATFD